MEKAGVNLDAFAARSVDDGRKNHGFGVSLRATQF